MEFDTILSLAIRTNGDKDNEWDAYIVRTCSGNEEKRIDESDLEGESEGAVGNGWPTLCYYDHMTWW